MLTLSQFINHFTEWKKVGVSHFCVSFFLCLLRPENYFILASYRMPKFIWKTEQASWRSYDKRCTCLSYVSDFILQGDVTRMYKPLGL